MIDRNYHPWLIEINRNPCVKIEKDMPDIKTLKKIFYHRLIDILIHGFYTHTNSNFVPVFPPVDWTTVHSKSFKLGCPITISKTPGIIMTLDKS